MNKFKIFLWNVCDYATPRHMVIFRISAYILHLLKCDYWFNSQDYKGV